MLSNLRLSGMAAEDRPRLGGHLRTAGINCISLTAPTTGPTEEGGWFRLTRHNQAHRSDLQLPQFASSVRRDVAWLPATSRRVVGIEAVIPGGDQSAGSSSPGVASSSSRSGRASP